MNEKTAKKVEPQYFRIENKGTSDVRNIKVLSSNVVDTYKLDRLLEQVLEQCLTDKEKAMALWQFVIDYSYHWSPPYRGKEAHEPLRLFNLFGYGFCDDTAQVLAKLWYAAGLRSRLWHLGGHVVPEVYYAGKWHLFDPDHRIYYTSAGTILGVHDLENHPEIVERTLAPLHTNARKIATIYATRADNAVSETVEAIRIRELNVTLRPGESWRRYRESKLGYYDAYRHEEPPHYANSVFTFRPDFKRIKASSLFHQLSNMGTHRDHRNIKGLGLLPRKTSGHFVYRFKQPFIGVNGTLRIRGRDKSGLSALDISGSRDGKQWSSLKEITHVGDAELHIGLGELVYGSYHYWLKIAMNAVPAADVSISSLEVETVTQSSPLSFPIIKPGENRITVDFEASEEKEKTQLLFEYVWEEKVEKRPWWKFF